MSQQTTPIWNTTQEANLSISSSIQGKLHSVLHNDFWLQLVEGISEELELQRAVKKAKISLNDVDSNNTSDLFQLTTKYGYTPNLLLDNSLGFLRSEVKSIPFRVTNKTTVKGLRFAFTQAGRRGDVYKTFYNSSNIIKLIDIDVTLNNAKIHDYTTPFTGIEPMTVFVFSDPGTLDIGETLDTGDTLDASTVLTPTKHFLLEYQLDRLIVEDGVDYSITPSYIRFLESESDYNNRMTAIPHVGLQIASIISNSPYYDYKQISSSNYSINEIELQSAVLEPHFSNISDTGDGFTYFVAGTGKKGLPSKDYIDIFDDAVLHYPFNYSLYSNTLVDATGSYSDATITGNLKRVQGITGRSLNYAVDTYTSLSSFLLPAGNMTLNMWVKVTKEKIDTDDKDRYLFSSENLNVYYSETDTMLYISISDGITTYIGSVYEGEIGTEIFLQVEIDDTNDLMNIYVNSVLEDTTSLSGNLGFSTTSDLVLGSKYDDASNSDYYFNGLIDELSIHSRLFNTDEKTFLYETQFGGHDNLGNIVYRVALTSRQVDREIKGDSTYLSLNGEAKANYVNIDIAGTSDGITDYITGTSFISDIVKGSLEFSYEEGSTTVTISDNKVGYLEGDMASGIIDYSTGDFTLNFYKTTPLDNELYSVNSETTIGLVLNTTVETSSFRLSYSFNGITYEAEDNGLGTILGTNVSAGTIDYDTGAVSITLSSATDEGSPIYYSYTYREDDIPIDGTVISMRYQTNNDLELSECGYEDVNNNLVQYSNFPRASFGTTKAHLSNHTIIELE